jgi:hypothetical protein
LTSAVGTAAADAPPTREKVNPAAPNAGAAALVTRFRFEACFTRDIVASSMLPICFESTRQQNCTLRHRVTQYACASRKALQECKVIDLSSDFWFMFMNEVRRRDAVREDS